MGRKLRGSDIAPAEAPQFQHRFAFQGLTPKQSAFARAVVSGMSFTDAYRETYDCEGMSDAAVHTAASVESRRPLVALKLVALREEAEGKATLAPTLTKNFIVDGLMALALHADKDSVKFQAYTQLGKVAGIDLFRETTRVERSERTPEQIDQDLRAMLASIRTIEGEAQHVEPEARPARRRTRNTPT